VSRPRSRLGPVDLAVESLAGVARRPARAILTALGTVLGVAAFVATLGITSTASAQIGVHFDRLKATEVVVQDGRPDAADPAFPADTEQRLSRLNGVRDGGTIWTVPGSDSLRVRTAPPVGAPDPAGTPVNLVAASPGALAAAGVSVREGRVFDAFHSDRSEPVALVGAAVAGRLGVHRVDRQQSIFVGDRAVTVLGIVDRVERRTDLLLSVIVPAGTALAWFDRAAAGTPQVLVSTELGAAQLIGRQLPLALRPHDPDRLVALVPPDPTSLRGNVESETRLLFLLLAGVSLVIGAVGIANTTLVSVLERTGEIGLRRSLGAARRHIGGQFLAESAMLGSLGGLVGSCLGLVVVTGVAMVRQWTVVVEPLTVLPAPLIGTLVGVAAGLYPAWKAARIEPVEALRR
jgi:putative ABC transport system permease protein